MIDLSELREKKGFICDMDGVISVSYTHLNRRIFFRNQAQMDTRPCIRRARAREAGRAFIRNGGYLAAVEPDKRQGTCDGPDKRLAHDDVQHPQPYICLLYTSRCV